MENQLTEVALSNKEICKDFFEELHNYGNFGAIDKYVAQDVILHSPFPGQDKGAKGMKDIMRIFRSAFPDLHVVFDELIAEEDRVMTMLTVKGTHKGRFMGVNATGNPIEYKEMVLLRFKDGKIVEHWAIADALSLMQQLEIIR